MRHVPAFTGEFGLKVRYWVPQVYALCQAEPCIVEMEAGEEALYPAATKRRVVPRPEDASRFGSPPDLKIEEQRFVPEPHVRQGVVYSDVVVCPRKRDYGKAKNWDGWLRLPMELEARGWNVFAAGAPDSSYPVSCPAAWNYSRFLDASIEAMRQAKLVIATDAGLAHLAMLCGVDLLLISHEGRVAPGPVISSKGNRVHNEYWPIRVHEYYEKANHRNARIEIVDGWDDVGAVVDSMEGMLRERAA